MEFDFYTVLIMRSNAVDYTERLDEEQGAVALNRVILIKRKTGTILSCRFFLLNLNTIFQSGFRKCVQNQRRFGYLHYCVQSRVLI